MGLSCANCGYDNDPTRVYCHNCGLRLERGSAPFAPPTGFSPPGEVEQKKRRQRARLAWGKYFAAFCRLVILAGLAAAAVLAFLPPADLPAPLAPDDACASRITSLIADSASADGKRSFAVPSSELVTSFVTLVKFRPASGLLHPKRVYAVPGEGDVRVGIEASLSVGPRIYFEGVYAPEEDAAGMRLVARSFSIGRLPLPSAAGMIASRQFSGLGAALSVPLSQLSRASEVRITPATTTLSWSGGKP
ncbi:MAG: zinc ribbon domain-containing protein [Chthoniobacterales bacterium]|nr:zinc ribbon domain-containing protein [Chthoniobacterales bacterium]